jgi:anti-sigma B factor antagonist
MQTQLFEATLRPGSEQATTAVADLRGNVNREAEPALSQAYDAAFEGGADTLLLNLEDVHYINSTGIAVIVGLVARARKDSRTIAVCGLSEHYRTIFEITRLIDFMHVFPDETTALAGDRQPGT